MIEVWAKLRWTKLKTFTVCLAGVSVGLIVTRIPVLSEVGGYLFTAAAIASVYLMYKDMKREGKEVFL